jgi:hypothetical protein
MTIHRTLTWFATRLAIGALLLAATYFSANAQTSGTSTLTVTVPPLAAITINTASTVLTASSSFSPYTGTVGRTFGGKSDQHGRYTHLHLQRRRRNRLCQHAGCQHQRQHLCRQLWSRCALRLQRFKRFGDVVVAE